MLEIASDSAEATMRLGKTLGASMVGGEFIELIGDVGAGKTTFVRGIAAGAGADAASSPTFAIANSYKGRVNIEHLDLYRLKEAGLIAHQIEEALEDPNSTIIIEWGGAAESVLPVDRLRIKIAATSENGRQLTFEMPEKFNYLMKVVR